MRIPTRVVLLYLPSLLTIAAWQCVSAPGQPLFEHKASLEWLTADSDVVVRATITDVVPLSSKGHDVWHTVTLRVRETLKGTDRPAVTLAVRRWRPDEDLIEWKKQRREFLLFLVDGDRYARDDDRYSEFKWAPYFVNYGVPASSTSTRRPNRIHSRWI